jgi:hypothetical protein
MNLPEEFAAHLHCCRRTGPERRSTSCSFFRISGWRDPLAMAPMLMVVVSTKRDLVLSFVELA